MKHYYFKYLSANQGIDIWYQKKGLSEEIDLSIYYGEWKTANYHSKDTGKQHFNNIKQIDTFFNLQYSDEVIYFWIYYKDNILCFKALDRNVYDGPEMHFLRIDNKTEYPKSIKAVLVRSFEKINLPEFFSNINSNQYYNRTTIKELKGSESQLASSLINGEHLKINIETLYDYLSPMQFETLLFQIFTTGNSFCSSFRGGTLKDYDLKIILNKMFHGIPAGKHWIQVKLKGDPKIDINGYLAYIGNSDIKNKIIGTEWITNRILDRKDILIWLKKCVFDHELLDFDVNGPSRTP